MLDTVGRLQVLGLTQEQLQRKENLAGAAGAAWGQAGTAGLRAVARGPQAGVKQRAGQVSSSARSLWIPAQTGSQ